MYNCHIFMDYNEFQRNENIKESLLQQPDQETTLLSISQVFQDFLNANQNIISHDRHKFNEIILKDHLSINIHPEFF
jgi:hypothetical protein